MREREREKVRESERGGWEKGERKRQSVRSLLKNIALDKAVAMPTFS